MEYSYSLPNAGMVTLNVDKTGDTYKWSVNRNDGEGFVEMENATSQSYTLPVLNASMQGWQFSCTVIKTRKQLTEKKHIIIPNR